MLELYYGLWMASSRVKIQQSLIVGEQKLAHLIFVLYLVLLVLSVATLFRKLEQADVVTMSVHILVSVVILLLIILADFALPLPVVMLTSLAVIIGLLGVVRLHAQISQPKEKQKNEHQVLIMRNFASPNDDGDGSNPWL